MPGHRGRAFGELGATVWLVGLLGLGGVRLDRLVPFFLCVTGGFFLVVSVVAAVTATAAFGATVWTGFGPCAHRRRRRSEGRRLQERKTVCCGSWYALRARGEKNRAPPRGNRHAGREGSRRPTWPVGLRVSRQNVRTSCRNGTTCPGCSAGRRCPSAEAFGAGSGWRYPGFAPPAPGSRRPISSTVSTWRFSTSARGSRDASSAERGLG